MVVELRVLELREVERRRVLHEPHAEPVAEQVTEQALDEARGAREQLARNDDRELESDEPGDGAPRSTIALRGDDAVDDELPDPERRDRYECANEPQRGHGNRVAAVRFPDEPYELRDVPKGVDALAECRLLARLRLGAPPPAAGPVGDHVVEPHPRTLTGALGTANR